MLGMMGGPKKKLASVIVDKLAEKPVDMDAPEEDSSLGQKSAAEKVLKAIEAKDASMLVAALNEFTDMKVDEAPELPEV